MHVQLGMIENQLKNKSQIVHLTPEEMRRHEVMMTMKLQEAEEKAKEKATGAQVFFEKSKKHRIGKPVGKRRGKSTTKRRKK